MNSEIEKWRGIDFKEGLQLLITLDNAAQVSERCISLGYGHGTITFQG